MSLGIDMSTKRMRPSENIHEYETSFSKQQSDEADIILQELDGIVERKNRADEMSLKLKDMLKNEKEAVRSFNSMRMQERQQKEQEAEEEINPDKEDKQEEADSVAVKNSDTMDSGVKSQDAQVFLATEDDLDYLDDEKEEIVTEQHTERQEDDREDFLASLDKRTEKIVQASIRKAEPKRLTSKRNANRDEKIFINNIRSLAAAKLQNMIVLVSYIALVMILFAALLVDRKNMPEEATGFLTVDNSAFVEFVSKYYEALETEDLDTVKLLLKEGITVEDEYLLNRMEEVKMYKDNIYDTFRVTDCAVQAGLEKNEYVVYCKYEIKIKKAETAAPGLLTLYVANVAKEAEEPEYRLIINAKDSKRYAYMVEKGEENAVKALIKDTNEALKKACEQDENLNKIVDALKNFRLTN